MYSRLITTLFVGCMAASGMVLPAAASAPAPGIDIDGAGPVCETHELPVRITDPGEPTERMWGELCYPRDEKPSAVQFLVHGGYYNHSYWDFKEKGDSYSYVRAATAAGYATFNVDRIGSGNSSHPPSAAVDGVAGSVALHDAITTLRFGKLDGHAFERVVWVGHSLGSLHAWIGIPRYQDVDAAVLTGALHASNPEHVKEAAAKTRPAVDDPKFADSGLDRNYLTTKPGTRGELFYRPETSEPAVIEADEANKDVLALTPPKDPLPIPHDIRVPVLLIAGEKDFLYCDGVAEYDCAKPETVRAFESKFYLPETDLEVATVPNTGHNLALSTTAPITTAIMLDWTRGTVAP